jgi:RNA polymerase sigma-70 factor (ECF subfamily)
MIEDAEALLVRASRMGTIGRYQLEAAIQSAHVVRRRTGAADWDAIEKLYSALATLTGSQVVTINRAAALAETRGPAAGLELLDSLAADARLNDYQPYWAARAGLLARAGEVSAAEEAYDRAIGLEADPAVRRFLQQRRGSLRKH